MAKVLNGLPTSFTNAMNKELVKHFTTLKFFKVVEGMTDGKAPGHDDIPI